MIILEIFRMNFAIMKENFEIQSLLTLTGGRVSMTKGLLSINTVSQSNPVPGIAKPLNETSATTASLHLSLRSQHHDKDRRVTTIA